VSPDAGTILSADLFHSLGGYDTAMPIYGAAEPEFSVRLWLSGAEIVTSPDLVLQHRFRPHGERQRFLAGIRQVQLQNYLRFGMLYLDVPRALQMVRQQAARSPQIFDQALRSVWASDVWHRRQLLERSLPYQFSSYVTYFGLLDAYGQLAC
jgi:hypothetical protein